MKLLYPAIFYPCEAKENCTFVVPDLPGCVSEGDSLADPILMGGRCRLRLASQISVACQLQQSHQSSQITPFFMQRCTSFIERRPITGSFDFFALFCLCFYVLLLFFISIFGVPHIFFQFILPSPCFAKITSHVNTSFKAFLAKMGTLSGSTRPALRFSRTQHGA